jgi:hypothetical protein
MVIVINFIAGKLKPLKIIKINDRITVMFGNGGENLILQEFLRV